MEIDISPLATPRSHDLEDAQGPSSFFGDLELFRNMAQLEHNMENELGFENPLPDLDLGVTSRADKEDAILESVLDLADRLQAKKEPAVSRLVTEEPEGSDSGSHADDHQGGFDDLDDMFKEVADIEAEAKKEEDRLEIKQIFIKDLKQRLLEREMRRNKRAQTRGAPRLDEKFIKDLKQRFLEREIRRNKRTEARGALRLSEKFIKDLKQRFLEREMRRNKRAQTRGAPRLDEKFIKDLKQHLLEREMRRNKRAQTRGAPRLDDKFIKDLKQHLLEREMRRNKRAEARGAPRSEGENPISQGGGTPSEERTAKSQRGRNKGSDGALRRYGSGLGRSTRRGRILRRSKSIMKRLARSLSRARRTRAKASMPRSISNAIPRGLDRTFVRRKKPTGNTDLALLISNTSPRVSPVTHPLAPSTCRTPTALTTASRLLSVSGVLKSEEKLQQVESKEDGDNDSSSLSLGFEEYSPGNDKNGNADKLPTKSLREIPPKKSQKEPPIRLSTSSRTDTKMVRDPSPSSDSSEVLLQELNNPTRTRIKGFRDNHPKPRRDSSDILCTYEIAGNKVECVQAYRWYGMNTENSDPKKDILLNHIFGCTAGSDSTKAIYASTRSFLYPAGCFTVLQHSFQPITKGESDARNRPRGKIPNFQNFLELHNHVVSALGIDHSREVVATGQVSQSTHMATIHVWKLDSLSRVATVTVGLDEILTLSFDPSGNILLVGGTRGDGVRFAGWKWREEDQVFVVSPKCDIKGPMVSMRLRQHSEQGSGSGFELGQKLIFRGLITTDQYACITSITNAVSTSQTYSISTLMRGKGVSSTEHLITCATLSPHSDLIVGTSMGWVLVLTIPGPSITTSSASSPSGERVDISKPVCLQVKAKQEVCAVCYFEELLYCATNRGWVVGIDLKGAISFEFDTLRCLVEPVRKMIKPQCMKNKSQIQPIVKGMDVIKGRVLLTLSTHQIYELTIKSGKSSLLVHGLPGPSKRMACDYKTDLVAITTESCDASTAHIFNLKQKRRLPTDIFFEATVTALSFAHQSSQTQTLAAGLSSGKVILLKFPTMEVLAEFRLSSSPITCIALSLSSLCVAAESGELVVFPLKAKATEVSLQPMGSPHVMCIDFDTSGRILTSNHVDYCIRYWDLRSGERIRDPERIRDVEVDCHNCVLGWHVKGLSILQKGMESMICSLAPRSHCLAFGDRSQGSISISCFPYYSPKAPRFVHNAHTSGILMGFGMEEKALVSTAVDNCVMFWELIDAPSLLEDSKQAPAPPNFPVDNPDHDHVDTRNILVDSSPRIVHENVEASSDSLLYLLDSLPSEHPEEEKELSSVLEKGEDVPELKFNAGSKIANLQSDVSRSPGKDVVQFSPLKRGNRRTGQPHHLKSHPLCQRKPTKSTILQLSKEQYRFLSYVVENRLKELTGECERFKAECIAKANILRKMRKFLESMEDLVGKPRGRAKTVRAYKKAFLSNQLSTQRRDASTQRLHDLYEVNKRLAEECERYETMLTSHDLDDYSFK